VVAVLDASVIVSWLWGRDRFHDRSRWWLEQAADRGVTIGGPAILPAEVAGPIARISGSSDDGLYATQVLRDLAFLELHDVDPWQSARLAAELKIRGCDSVYVQLADRFSVPLLTYDRDLAERASEVVTVLRPENWVW
jgi:predicted nucleic acid-binding protein